MLAALFALYVLGYLATVCRDDSISSVKTVAEGELTHNNVGAHWRGGRVGSWIGYNLYSPAYKVDRRYFRRHFWSPYYVLRGPRGTQVMYSCDEKRDGSDPIRVNP